MRTLARPLASISLLTVLGCSPPGDAPAPEAATTEGSGDLTMVDDASPSLSFEDIASYPRPGTSVPGRVSFTPDGKGLTFLDSPDDSLTRELYVLNLDLSLIHI